YRPDRIDLEDSAGNSTNAPAAEPSSPEFAIHRAFNLVGMMPPPAAREAVFADVLTAPGHRQSHWDAVIKSAVPEGNDIRAEIVVWSWVSVFEGGRFRTITVPPFLETWIYKDYRLSFVSGKPAAQKGNADR